MAKLLNIFGILSLLVWGGRKRVHWKYRKESSGC